MDGGHRAGVCLHGQVRQAGECLILLVGSDSGQPRGTRGASQCSPRALPCHLADLHVKGGWWP